MLETAQTFEREFRPWPKIARFNRDIIVTEKIDGTNGCIVVTPDDIYAQSRSRVLSLKEDNHSFAHWVHEHADELREQLGEGRHYGEWWGGNIGKRYRGVIEDQRFSLFNVDRWHVTEGDGWRCIEAPLCHVVPTIFRLGTFDSDRVLEAVEYLRQGGSIAAPGCEAEGLVVFHPKANVMFKVTLERDDEWKGKAA